MSNRLLLATLAIPLLAISSEATVLFDFRTTQGGGGVVDGDGNGPTSGSNFDTSAVGDVIVLDGLTTTIVDIFAPEYDVSGATPVLTGNILSGSAGGVVTNIASQDALGIANPSINNSQFDLIGGGTESSDFNTGEGIVFSFDQDVMFTSIELESVVASDIFRVLVDGTQILEVTGDDSFIDDLGDLGSTVITAGSQITFEADGPVATSSFRIETFEVDVIAVPEPSSLALLGLGSLVMFKRRRN